MDSPNRESAIVGEENHHGIVVHPVVAKTLQDLPHPDIDSADRVEVACPLLSHDGMIGIERRRRHVVFRGHLGVPFLADPDDPLFFNRLPVVDVVLRLRHIDLREERLLQFVPLLGVVEVTLVDEIQVEFARTGLDVSEMRDVSRRVAHLGQPMSEGTDPVGQAIVIVAMGSHVMGVGGGLIHPGEETRPARSTDRRRRERIPVADSLLGQTIDMGRGHVFFPIAGEIVREILCHDPDDVRTILGRKGKTGHECRERDEKKNATKTSHGAPSKPDLPPMTMGNAGY